MTINYEKILFAFINTLGPVWNFHDKLTIMDNTGKNANGGKYYVCYLRGGIHFEIYKARVVDELEEDDEGNMVRVAPTSEFTYRFFSYWEGELKIDTAKKAINVLEILGFEKELAKAES